MSELLYHLPDFCHLSILPYTALKLLQILFHVGLLGVLHTARRDF